MTKVKTAKITTTTMLAVLVGACPVESEAVLELPGALDLASRVYAIEPS